MRHRLLMTSALLCTALAASPALPQQAGQTVANPANWPVAKTPRAATSPAVEARVTALMATMTLEEKVGQMIQGDIGSVTPDDLARYPLGSILAGGNSAPGGNEYATPQQWADLAKAFRAAAASRPGARIPLIFGVDSVHGHNNVVGATIFPHNIGLGAARDPALMRRIARITALESAATGVDWTFGPTLAVPRDDRWGRTYEGYSEDPEIVASYAGPVTLGLQGPLVTGKVMTPGFIAGSAKHFLADGGTLNGKDQGDAAISEAELIRVHNAGYPPAINAGVLSIMISFSSWNGVKLSANQSLLDGVLKKRMGFDGFLVSDWNAHGQIPGCSNISCPQAINAGLDMMMAPDSWKGLYENTLAQARSGEIPITRIDDAVRRILRAKILTGLFEQGRYALEGQTELVGAPAHRAVAREAVRKSLVLLKNNDRTLPIRGGANVLVAGSGADDIGKQSGGWTITWQGTGNTNANFPGGQSIGAGIKSALEAQGGSATISPEGTFGSQKPDVAVVVFGETPYAEFMGDVEHLDFENASSAADLALMRRLRAEGIKVVAVFLSGRPMWTNPEINAADAFVAAWLPGSEGGGVADVLVGDTRGRPRHDFKGRLSFSWPATPSQGPVNRGDSTIAPLFAWGHGLTYRAARPLGTLSEAAAVQGTAAVDSYFVAGQPVAPWSLLVRDSVGEQRATGAEIQSPGGAVSLKATDAGAQESGRTITFGPAGGNFLISGPPVDLTRQSNAELSLSFKLRLDTPLAEGTALGLNNANIALRSVAAEQPVGEWRTVAVRLSCFGALGANLAAVDNPFRLTATQAATLSIADVRLAPSIGGTRCP